MGVSGEPGEAFAVCSVLGSRSVQRGVVFFLVGRLYSITFTWFIFLTPLADVFDSFSLQSVTKKENVNNIAYSDIFFCFQLFSQFGVEELDWPAQSPDLYPIQNLRDSFAGPLWARGPFHKSNLWALLIHSRKWQHSVSQMIITYKMEHLFASHKGLACPCVGTKYRAYFKLQDIKINGSGTYLMLQISAGILSKWAQKLSQQQLWTSPVLLWLKRSKSLQPASSMLWKAWNQKSGGCYSGRLMPMVLQDMIHYHL